MKKFVWSFTIGDETYHGEADTLEDAQRDMLSKGWDSEDMDSEEIRERSDEEMVRLAREAANPPEHKTSMQHLAEANAIMFAQLNTLKNQNQSLADETQAALFEVLGLQRQITVLESFIGDMKSLLLAWNTEQHARLGAAHEEPPFIALAREWTLLAPEDRKSQNGCQQSEREPDPGAADTAILPRSAPDASATGYPSGAADDVSHPFDAPDASPDASASP